MRESVGGVRALAAPNRERRHAPRLAFSFPVAVVGVDAGEGAFDVSTVLDNISAAGLYVKLGRRVEPGTPLLVVVHLCAAGRETLDTARVAINGLVLRSEPQPCGACGLAVKFTSHRFL